MKYSLVKRGNPRYPERGKKFYASAQYEKVMTQNELIDHILSHGSTLTRGDYKAAITDMAHAMAELMAEGYKIDIEELGKFYPTLESEGVEHGEAFEPQRHVKSVRVNWQPSQLFANLKERASFREVMNRRSERKVIKAVKEGDSGSEL